MVYNGLGSFSIQVCFTTLTDNVENKSKCPWTERGIFFHVQTVCTIVKIIIVDLCPLLLARPS